MEPYSLTRVSRVHISLLALSLQVVIPLSLWHLAGASPDLRLPFQPQSVTALWLLPNYTAWWQRHTSVSRLAGTRTCNPWIASLMKWN